MKWFKKFFGFKFEYFRSPRSGKWYFHLKAKNNEVIAHSQGYRSKRDCLKGLAAVKRGALFAKKVYRSTK